MVHRSQLFLLSLLLLLLGCSTGKNPSLPHTTSRIVSNAEKIGFTRETIPTRTFLLTSYQKLSRTPSLINGTPNSRLSNSINGTSNSTIYAFIEGDGRSWKTKYRLSNNPTPHQPLALKLAVLSADPKMGVLLDSPADPKMGVLLDSPVDPKMGVLLDSPEPKVSVLLERQVVYFARPCQYTPHDLDKSCDPKYWSSHRYAVEVIDSMNEALDHVKAKAHNHHFVLVGFSGGASVAALIAAKRKDVIGLITIAGDLDNQALNAHHGTTPLYGSLNPIDIAPSLKNLAQHHWSGSKDKVVPVWVAERFVRKVNSPCAHHHILKDASHHQGWEAHWQTILNTPLTCSNS